MPFSYVPLVLMPSVLTKHPNPIIYAAQGSNSSWYWIRRISPCVDLLRQLITHMNNILGSKQGSKHHKPDLSKDIRLLIKSMREHGVYEIKPGRTIEDDKAEVPNIIAQGFLQLKGPLRDYNTAFARSQKRRLLVPLVGKDMMPPLPAMAAQPPVADVRVEEGVPDIALTQTNTQPEETGPALPLDKDDDDEVDEDELWEVCDGLDTLPLSLESEEDVDIDDYQFTF